MFVTDILLTGMHALLSFKVINKSIVLHINGILVSIYSKDVCQQFTQIIMNGRKCNAQYGEIIPAF